MGLVDVYKRQVVFGVPLKDGLKDNPLRRVRHGLLCIVDSHTVLFELCLVDSGEMCIRDSLFTGRESRMMPQELKNSILQLAIQGKLVEQRPEERCCQSIKN